MQHTTDNTVLYTERQRTLIVLADKETRQPLVTVTRGYAEAKVELPISLTWYQMLINCHFKRSWIELSYTEMAHMLQVAKGIPL